MPYVAVAATVNVSYHCSFCGAEGEVEVEGDEFVGNMFGCYGFNCPECGENLSENEDLDERDEGNEQDEDEEEDE